MGYSIIQQDNDVSYNVIQCVVNLKSEIADLPTTFSSGSTAFVIEDSSVYMLSVGDATGIKVWKEI